ncbi:MAG: hypothetical protein ABIH92_00885 [Nanoarchaeota archaeon]
MFWKREFTRYQRRKLSEAYSNRFGRLPTDGCHDSQLENLRERGFLVEARVELGINKILVYALTDRGRETAEALAA